MNYDEIITFLSAVEHENIAKAANLLFISQGTASSRIQHLEKKLGVQLLFRQKGIKTVTLTPEGEVFITIAQQMLSLWKQAEQIKTRLIFKELRIAAVDMLNRFMFADVYKEFMITNPDITLYLQTEHSTEIHQLIESQQIDLGFVFSLHKSPNVIAMPLYQEQLVFLYHQNTVFAHTQNPQDLKTQYEIYSTISNEFELWHRRRFSDPDHKRITIGTLSMLPSFLSDTTLWSIVPESFASVMIGRNPNLRYTPITEDPPPIRTAYILIYKYPKPWVRDLANLFLKDIVIMIRQNPSLQLLYKE